MVVLDCKKAKNCELGFAQIEEPLESPKDVQRGDHIVQKRLERFA